MSKNSDEKKQLKDMKKYEKKKKAIGPERGRAAGAGEHYKVKDRR